MSNEYDDFGQAPMAPPPPPPPAGPVGPPRTSGLAIASLILGVVAILPICCGTTAIIAIPLGIAALSAIGRSGGQITGRGMAIVGMVLGILSILLYVGFAVMFGPRIGSYYPGMGLAMNEANKAFADLQSERYGAVYDRTGPAFREGKTKEQFEAEMKDLAERRGSVTSFVPTDVDQWSWVRGGTGPHHVEITYQLSWSKGGTTSGLLRYEWPRGQSGKPPEVILVDLRLE